MNSHFKIASCLWFWPATLSRKPGRTMEGTLAIGGKLTTRLRVRLLHAWWRTLNCCQPPSTGQRRGQPTGSIFCRARSQRRGSERELSSSDYLAAGSLDGAKALHQMRVSCSLVKRVFTTRQTGNFLRETGVSPRPNARRPAEYGFYLICCPYLFNVIN